MVAGEQQSLPRISKAPASHQLSRKDKTWSDSHIIVFPFLSFFNLPQCPKENLTRSTGMMCYKSTEKQSRNMTEWAEWVTATQNSPHTLTHCGTTNTSLSFTLVTLPHSHFCTIACYAKTRMVFNTRSLSCWWELDQTVSRLFFSIHEAQQKKARQIKREDTWGTSSECYRPGEQWAELVTRRTLALLAHTTAWRRTLLKAEKASSAIFTPWIIYLQCIE